MDRALFLDRLTTATDRAVAHARSMVVNELPGQVRYRVLLNQSYDGNPLGPEEQVFLRDMADRDLLLDDCEQVVDRLWRAGSVPEWINVSVRSADERFTLVQLLCCGRFIAREAILYHQREGISPFHVLSPPMPPGSCDGKTCQPFNLFWRQRLDEQELAAHYPEVADHGGSLAALLRAILLGDGFSLDIRDEEDPGSPRPAARARLAGRTIDVLPTAKERSCSAHFWERGVQVAKLQTGDLGVIATAMWAWCADRLRPADLVSACPGVEVDRERVTAYEAGPELFANYCWQEFLDVEKKPLSPAVRAAAEVPVLRRLRPFVTMNRLGFSRCTGHPFTGDGPLIVPVHGNGTFQVIGTAGMTVGTGTASEAAASPAKNLPPGGPVRHGTAEELQ